MTAWSPAERSAHKLARRRSLLGADEWLVMRRYDVYAAMTAEVAGSLHTMHAVEIARYRNGNLLEPSHADH